MRYAYINYTLYPPPAQDIFSLNSRPGHAINHQTIELVRELTPLDVNGRALVRELREAVFRYFARGGRRA